VSKEMTRCIGQKEGREKSKHTFVVQKLAQQQKQQQQKVTKNTKPTTKHDASECVHFVVSNPKNTHRTSMLLHESNQNVS
jgi:NADP-dependent 3-hydroxy acid dehydrogenase YdfG